MGVKGGVETLSYDNVKDLRGVVLRFFNIDIQELSQEHIIVLNNFCIWLRKSIIWVKKENRWKYINFDEGTTGSFTLARTQGISHLFDGVPSGQPWLHFSFHLFHEGVSKFIHDMGIEYRDEAQDYFSGHIDRLKEIHTMLLSGDINHARISDIGEEDIQEYRRSSFMDFLKILGLDYGADTEYGSEVGSEVPVPINYIDI